MKLAREVAAVSEYDAQGVFIYKPCGVSATQDIGYLRDDPEWESSQRFKLDPHTLAV